MNESYFDGSGHDRQAVAFFDAAHEGAQVRAVSGVLEHLEGFYHLSPRSVIIVATDQISRAAANVVSRLLSPLRVPVVITDVLPTYVGPLDLVMFVGDHADDCATSQGLLTADRRGAPTVLAGPPRGPVIEDAPSRTIIVPSLPNAYGLSPARAITAIATVLDSLEEQRELVGQRLEVVAETIDAELEQLSPERDSMVNPGRQLREFASDARLIHTGSTGVGIAVAEMVAAIWTIKGLPSAVAEMEELSAAAPLSPPVDDIFHDPFIDGGAVLLPLKTIVWAEDPAVAGTLSHALSVTYEATEAGLMAGALRLITRGLAATTYDLPEAPVED